MCILEDAPLVHTYMEIASLKLSLLLRLYIDQSVSHSGYVRLYYNIIAIPTGVACETRLRYVSYIFSGRQSTCDGLQTPRGTYGITDILLKRCL